jgi:lipopolysaccharide transport system ATP-binding protein
MRANQIARKFDEIVEFSGCARYIDTPVKRYSSGMYVRLAFAVAAHLEPEILIVDEVLAERDAEFQKKMPRQNEGCRRPWPHDSLFERPL